MSIAAEDLERRLAGLDAIGAGEGGRAVNRLAWTPEDAACRDWFLEQARDAGFRRVGPDPAGNMWALPDGPGPFWAVGSHLDSVRDGGRYDGPLGVVCGFEIAARAQVPVAVISFADEEGARFNTPTFGSKALAGRLDLPAVLDRCDDAGVRLGDVIEARAPERTPEWLPLLRGFVEIHIDQTTDLARAAAPAAVVSGLTARRRLQVEVRGRADHSGTTPPPQRRDALLAAARLIAAADELAPGGVPRVTTSRIIAEPNAPTTIAARVRLWIDARGERIDEWEQALRAWARDLDRVEIGITVASRSDATTFDPELRAALRAALGDGTSEVVCYAGHDAGILAPHLPAAMMFVRNATGISHSPAEHVELDDAAVAATAVLRALERIS